MMTRVTIGELKKLIANLPDDYMLEGDTGGDYETWFDVRRPDDTLYAALDDLEPYETPDEREDRLHALGHPKRDLANHLDNLFNPPDQK